MARIICEHDFDAEPHRPDETRDDNCNHGLEGKALGLFDALRAFQ